MITRIGKEALKPNPELKPLEVLVGEWITTGTHPYFPGTTFHGRTSFGWVEGGAFLAMHTEIDEPEIPSGVCIFGSDDAAHALFVLYFDERRVSRKFDVAMAGSQLTWRRDNPSFAQRRTFTIEVGGQKIISTGEMSKDGGDWEEDLELTYVRTQ